MDHAFPPAENCGVKGLDAPEKIEDLADPIHLPVGYLAVELWELGGVTRYNEHPFTDGAQCPSNNFHNNLMDKMELNYFCGFYMNDNTAFKRCERI